MPYWLRERTRMPLELLDTNNIDSATDSRNQWQNLNTEYLAAQNCFKAQNIRKICDLAFSTTDRNKEIPKGVSGNTNNVQPLKERIEKTPQFLELRGSSNGSSIAPIDALCEEIARRRLQSSAISRRKHEMSKISTQNKENEFIGTGRPEEYAEPDEDMFVVVEPTYNHNYSLRPLPLRIRRYNLTVVPISAKTSRAPHIRKVIYRKSELKRFLTSPFNRTPTIPNRYGSHNMDNLRGSYSKNKPSIFKVGVYKKYSY